MKNKVILKLRLPNKSYIIKSNNSSYLWNRFYNLVKENEFIINMNYIEDLFESQMYLCEDLLKLKNITHKNNSLETKLFKLLWKIEYRLHPHS